MMRRALAAIALTLAASAAAFGQTNAAEARKELDLGARAYRGGRFAEAERRFRRALELDPEGKDTRVFIARAAQQQYRPGDTSPENIAAGERAVAAYQEVSAKDPANEDAYKALVFLHTQMKNEEKLFELLLSRANDASLPNDRRSEAFVLLAGKRWQCSFDVTEQKENKTSEQKQDKVETRYRMPADQGDFIRARQCMAEGLQLAEQAVALSPNNPNALSYRANLLREGAKLAEMEGSAGQQAEYTRQYEEALEQHRRVSAETRRPDAAGEQGAAAPPNVPAGEPGARAYAPEVKGKAVSGGVLNGRAVSKPAPVYPPEAKAAGAQGTVTVQVLVDEEGNVVSANAISGHPLLQDAAVRAARATRFAPTRLSGQPVKVSGVVTFKFVLE